jgi:purine-binding chemotaxis protein CheW
MKADPNACMRRPDDMNDKDKIEQSLAEPDTALLGYLQTLLDEIPEDLPPAPVARVQPTVLSVPKTVAPAVADVVTVVEPALKPSPAPVKTVLPQWAEGPFQVLQFEAGGGQLSIPLVCMRNIIRLEGELTKLPGHPPWHLGLLMVRGEKIGVVDLARLLAPHAPPRTQPVAGFVLILGDGQWGLACERIGKARNIFPDAVRWRKEGARAPYIHGVISDTLTPLLNTDDVLKTLTRFRRHP